MNSENGLFERKSGIILAADLADIELFRRIAALPNQFREVVAIKVGFTLALRYGLPAVVKAANDASGVPVIYDHQKAATDIPQMGEPFAKVCCDAGVSAVIFFPQAGPKTLEAFVSAANDSGLTPIVGLVMTHKSYLSSDGGYITDEAPEMIAQTAVNSGVRDFVLPGNKPEIVRRFASGSLLNITEGSIMMPGIGSQGGELTGAFQAAKPHRRYAIIGSAIYGATEPIAALEIFIRQMNHE
jgi:orotidine-5'-phosphate decarboxylase